MQKVRVGIIGQGRSGRNMHGAHLLGDARFQIAAVAETVEARRIRAAGEYGCETYADYRDLLARKDLDLVVVATWSHTHPAIVIECLEADHAVLCEKPMASTVKDADRMIAAARRTGRLLAVFQQSRFSPSFQRILEVIRSGVLGRVVQISMAYNAFSRRWDWQTLQDRWGGNLMNTGPHALDQALFLFGDGTPDVRCFMDRANSAGDAEDYVKVILSGPGRPVIDVEISSCCAYPAFTYNVQGTRGGLKGSTTQLEWKYLDPAATPPLPPVTDPIAKADGTPAYCSETLAWREDRWAFDPAASGAVEGTYQNAANDLSASAGRSRPQASSNYYAAMAAAYYDMLHAALTTGAPMSVTPAQVRRQMAVFEICRAQNPHVYAPPRPG